jgi:RNA polymerase sigma-70 factor (ECF subfamily)
MPAPARPNGRLIDNTLLKETGAVSVAVDNDAVRGARDCFNAQVFSNQERVFRFILTLVPNFSEAEDLLQQTLMTLWMTWDRFDPAQDFFRWACGIAHNHVRNYVRKRRTSAQWCSSFSNQLLEQLARERQELDCVLERRRQALQQCLCKLSPTERDLVARCYGETETIKGVADNAGQSSNAVYKQLRRIRAQLYVCISRLLGDKE